MPLAERDYMREKPSARERATGFFGLPELRHVLAFLGLALLAGCIIVATFTVFGPLAIVPVAIGIWLGLR